MEVTNNEDSRVAVSSTVANTPSSSNCTPKVPVSAAQLALTSREQFISNSTVNAKKIVGKNLNGTSKYYILNILAFF